MVWNVMKLLYCTLTRKEEWCNGTKSGAFRCTRCGSLHHS